VAEEARIGRSGEELLVNLINTDELFSTRFSECLKGGLEINVVGKIRAIRAKGMRKTDVIILDERGQRIGISLKTRRRSRPDDHLDRRWLDEWRATLNMSENVYGAFWQGIMRKAVNKRADLIPEGDRPLVESFLKSNLDKILEEAFRGGESGLHLFAIVEYGEKSTLYVFRLDDVINFIKRDIASNGINFRGVIYLGRFLWIQRKAGDSKEIDRRLPKTHPRHPGNQLQIKILPLLLKDEAIRELKYCELELPYRSMGIRRGGTLKKFL